jgi:hypothetical protein
MWIHCRMPCFSSFWLQLQAKEFLFSLFGGDYNEECYCLVGWNPTHSGWNFLVFRSSLFLQWFSGNTVDSSSQFLLNFGVFIPHFTMESIYLFFIYSIKSAPKFFACPSSRNPGQNPQPRHLGFLVNKVAKGKISLLLLQVSRLALFHTCCILIVSCTTDTLCITLAPDRVVKEICLNSMIYGRLYISGCYDPQWLINSEFCGRQLSWTDASTHLTVMAWNILEQ